MSRNGKKYLGLNAGHSNSESSDEEEFFARSSKTQKTKETSDVINSKNGFSGISKKKESQDDDQISTENTLKEMEMFEGMARKNIGRCSTKLRTFVSNQISELDDAKKKFVDSLMDELNRWKKYNDHLKYQESRLLEVFQTLKNKYYLMRTENNKFNKVREIHENFIKEHVEIMNKYEAEADALKNNIIKEVSDLKRKLFRKYQVEI